MHNKIAPNLEGGEQEQRRVGRRVPPLRSADRPIPLLKIARCVCGTNLSNVQAIILDFPGGRQQELPRVGLWVFLVRVAVI